MKRYVKDLTLRVNEITNIFSKPINKASVEDALSLVSFYSDYNDMSNLIEISESYVIEDTESFSSDLYALQEAVCDYFKCNKDDWFLSSLHDIIENHLAQIYNKYLQKHDEAEHFKQQYTPLDIDTFDKIAETHYKILKERDALYEYWTKEMNKYLITPVFKFKFIDVILVRFETALNEITNISQDDVFFKLLITKDKDLIEAAKLEDFVSKDVCFELYEIFMTHKIFANDKVPLSDFVCLLNLKPTHSELKLGPKKKLHLILVGWWNGNTIDNKKLRKKWKDTLYGQLNIDPEYENKQISMIKNSPSNQMSEYVKSVNKLFIEKYPGIKGADNCFL